MDALPAVERSEVSDLIPSDCDNSPLSELAPELRARTGGNRPDTSLTDLLAIPLLGISLRRKTTVIYWPYRGFRLPDREIGFVAEIEVLGGTFSLEPFADCDDLPINGYAVLDVYGC